MPKVRRYVRDKDGQFARVPGSGGAKLPQKSLRANGNADRRKASQALLKAHIALKNHEAYKERVEEKIRLGTASPTEKANVAKTYKNMPKAEQKRADAQRALDAIKGQKVTAAPKAEPTKAIAPKVPTGKAGSGRTAKGQTDRQREEVKISRGGRRLAKKRDAEESKRKEEDNKSDRLSRAERRVQMQEDAEAEQRSRMASGDLTPSKHRKEMASAQKGFSNAMDALVKAKDDGFDSESKKYKDIDEAMLRVGSRLFAYMETAKELKPDRSRDLADAKDLGDMQEIMMNRHPGLEVEGFNNKTLLDFRDESKGEIPNFERSAVLSLLGAVDDMLIKYPEGNVKKVYPTDMTKHHAHGERVIAHCERQDFGGEVSSNIAFNERFLKSDEHRNIFGGATAHTASGFIDSAQYNSDSRFHPLGYEKDPIRNATIHEFGHALDWIAYGAPGIRDMTEAEKRTHGTTKTKIRDDHNERNAEIRKRMIALWKAEGKPHAEGSAGDLSRSRGDESITFGLWMRSHISGYSMDKDRAGLHAQYDELIAEAFMDGEINGDDADIVNAAIYKHMLFNLEKRKRAGEVK